MNVYGNKSEGPACYQHEGIFEVAAGKMRGFWKTGIHLGPGMEMGLRTAETRVAFP
jgi:hypothetical protein